MYVSGSFSSPSALSLNQETKPAAQQKLFYEFKKKTKSSDTNDTLKHYEWSWTSVLSKRLLEIIYVGMLRGRPHGNPPIREGGGPNRPQKLGQLKQSDLTDSDWNSCFGEAAAGVAMVTEFVQLANFSQMWICTPGEHLLLRSRLMWFMNCGCP